ncbi:MAG: prolyl oligopeptidase family serine peptidase [Planctomycetales bacterium]|nr:prolyl oligopeptidase family serine peptidase [Planctomycetales bacterium]
MHEPTTRREFLAISGLSTATAMCADFARAEDADSVVTVDQHIQRLADEASLGMQFRGTTAAECRAWQAKFGDKLRSLLGPHRPPAEWKTMVERVDEFDDHRREHLVLTADGHPPLPVYLLVPRHVPDVRRPGVVAIHGHGPFGNDAVAGRDDLPEVAETIAERNSDFGRQLVRQGYVVAAPCMIPFGRRLAEANNEYKMDPCAITFVRLSLLGKLLMAENLRDCLWAVELLARHKQVDAKRLGCVGHSYGGRMTMLTAAIDSRIRVATPSGALNVMQERIGTKYSCGAQVIPGLLEYGDVPEIASLIAPRHCMWIAGKDDGLIKPQWAEKALTRIRRVYKSLGAEDGLLVDRWDGPHRWHGEAAYPFLAQVLQPPKSQ